MERRSDTMIKMLLVGGAGFLLGYIWKRLIWDIETWMIMYRMGRVHKKGGKDE